MVNNSIKIQLKQALVKSGYYKLDKKQQREVLKQVYLKLSLKK